MPTLIPTKTDIATGMFIDVTSVPAGRYDSAFDSYLIQKKDGVENHTLTLVLKINLNPVTTYGLPVFVATDADGSLFWIRPWPPAEWQSFKSKFNKQAMRWSNRFWLVPPAGFNKLDVSVGGRTYRPNIYCHLYIHFNNGATGAHRTIDVVNLHHKLNSGSFRSHEGLYDSSDTAPRTNESTDNTGSNNRHVNYLTVVHEIGHALGQPHIGVLHKDPLCSAAVFLDGTPDLVKNISPAIFQGGSNSQVCYGEYAAPDRSDNVMGSGTHFSAFNALPWQDRIAFHTHTKGSDWQVSLSRVTPKPV